MNRNKKFRFSAFQQIKNRQNRFTDGRERARSKSTKKLAWACKRSRPLFFPKSSTSGQIFFLMSFFCFSMDSPESWRSEKSRGVLLVFIFGFSMLSYGSIPVIDSTPGVFLCGSRRFIPIKGDREVSKTCLIMV